MGKLETPEKNELVVSAVSELLRAAGGDSIVALNALLEKTGRTVAKTTEKSTVASRKAAYDRMLEETDIPAMADMEEIAVEIMGRILANSLDTETGVLSAEQIKQQMEEFLDIQKLTEVFSVRAKRRKAALFRHMNEVLAAEGVKDPENTNAVIDVPELGKRFSREGCGYGDPTVDEGRLRVLLGEELWEQVCTEEEIPARVELHFSVEKALDLANRDPEVYTKLTECVLPGPAKTPRLNQRDIPPAKEK